MRDDATIGVDERALDDAALEALAEGFATPPPAALRARVLAAANQEAAHRRARLRWRMVGAVAAAAVLVLASLLARATRIADVRTEQIAALARTNADLETRIDAQARAVAGLQEALANQAQVLRVLGAPRTLTAALAPTEPAGARGRVLVDAATGETAVVVSGLPRPSEGKTYELWAIRGERPPEPAGVFAVAGEGAVAVRAERIERPAEVTAFAVSIEPTGGSKAPTGPIVLVGPVAG